MVESWTSKSLMGVWMLSIDGASVASGMSKYAGILYSGMIVVGEVGAGVKSCGKLVSSKSGCGCVDGCRAGVLLLPLGDGWRR